MLHAVNLTCESRVNPLGLDEPQPRFSWQMTSSESAVQSAYRIQVFQEAGETPIWDSGRVNERSSILVPYDGPALRPRTRYRWRVRVWDQKGRDSGYSEQAFWETGLMRCGFLADWITNPNKGDVGAMQPCPRLRTAPASSWWRSWPPWAATPSAAAVPSTPMTPRVRPATP